MTIITRLGAVVAAAVTVHAGAQTLGPAFEGEYEILDLGSVTGLPTPYGGLMFKPGDPNTLLIGGTANNAAAQVFQVAVTRDAQGRVDGFDCAEPVAAFAAYGLTGGIDGGLDVAPNGVFLYTSFPDNTLGQVKPGSVEPDRLIDLNPFGVSSSTGTLRVVPSGFAGAGQLKIASYNGSTWYDATLVPDGDGTFDVVIKSEAINVGGGPEGIVYITGGNPGFPTDSVLISAYGAGQVRAYEIDDNGDPVVESERLFVSGLSGAEGAAIDPLTGDFVFSTFGGGNRVIRVSGFTTVKGCPSDLNGDGSVDGADLGVLLANFGNTGGGVGDVNGDCVVNGADLGVLLAAWGACS